MSSRPAPRLAVLPEALAALGVAVVGAEVALGLVGGVPAAAIGAAVFVVLGLLAVRYVYGAEAMDSDYRRQVRLVGSREPTLRYWDAAIADARESVIGYELHLRPLLQRLYAVRLAERHGVSLETQPRKAAAIVGAELWPWIDPSRPRLTREPGSPVHTATAMDPAGHSPRMDPRRMDPRIAPETITGPTLTALIERLEQM